MIQQQPVPYILLGDFNAHHSLWGSSSKNSKCNLIENLLLNHPLTILNNEQYSYTHPATGSTSAIDLTFVNPSLSLSYSWKPLDDYMEVIIFQFFCLQTVHFQMKNIHIGN